MVRTGYHCYAGSVTELVRSNLVHKLMGIRLHALSKDNNNGVAGDVGGYCATNGAEMRRGNS